MCSSEASRAKHKFAVKRNSWPKTRGVAMNPVDHVSPTVSRNPFLLSMRSFLTHVKSHSLTVVETINISAKPPQSLAWPRQVKKPVSSQRGERVYFAEHRKQRTRYFSARGLFCFSKFSPNGWRLELGLGIRKAASLIKALFFIIAISNTLPTLTQDPFHLSNRIQTYHKHPMHRETTYLSSHISQRLIFKTTTIKMNKTTQISLR